jgi:hypothetical protein
MMTNEDIIRMAHEAGLHIATDHDWMPIIALAYAQKFAELVAAAEHTAVLQAIEDVYTLEEDRNSMFSDGYKYALDQIETLIRARGQE